MLTDASLIFTGSALCKLFRAGFFSLMHRQAYKGVHNLVPPEILVIPKFVLLPYCQKRKVRSHQGCFKCQGHFVGNGFFEEAAALLQNLSEEFRACFKVSFEKHLGASGQ